MNFDEERALATVAHEAIVENRGRHPRRQEKGLASIRKRVTEETALCCELLHGNAALAIGMVSTEVLRPEHPLMSAFGVSGKRSPERIARVVICRLGIKTVRHA